jgi:hypothetical protein
MRQDKGIVELDFDFIVDFEPDARATLLTLIGPQHDLEEWEDDDLPG